MVNPAQIFYDDKGNPTAVLISYQEWLQLTAESTVVASQRGLAGLSGAGIFKGVDGMEYQNQVRSEWPD